MEPAEAGSSVEDLTVLLKEFSSSGPPAEGATAIVVQDETPPPPVEPCPEALAPKDAVPVLEDPPKPSEPETRPPPSMKSTFAAAPEASSSSGLSFRGH